MCVQVIAFTGSIQLKDKKHKYTFPLQVQNMQIATK